MLLQNTNKRRKYGSLRILAIVLLISACSSSKDETGESAEVNGKKIPIINLGLVEEEPTTIGWSAIFEDVEIIPLETGKNCMIKRWMTGLSPNSLYLATKTSSDVPVRLMEFDFEGKYLKDFGAGGKGPGEHISYSLNDVRYYEEYNMVLANFHGFTPENQLFTPKAEFLEEVKNSFEMGSGFGMIDENLFFTLGTLFGKPNYRRDSVLIEWHDKNGNPVKTIERTKYPPENNTSFSPTGSRSLYRYDGEWRLYSSGNDTIYEVVGKEINPIGIFTLGEKAVQLNEFVDPREVLGHFNIRILAENENYWILKKSVYTKCDVEHHGGGQWAGRVDYDHSLIFIRKDNLKSWHVRFKDDLLGIISWDRIDYYLKWDDSGRFYLILGAMSLIETIDEVMKAGEIPESGKEKVKKLRESINENSNPVLFMFKEREEYKLGN